MRRSMLERSLSDVHARLVKARAELAVLDEAADDTRIRSLVSETPMATHEHTDAKRHADAARRARDAVAASIADLERRQDELLDRLVVET